MGATDDGFLYLMDGSGNYSENTKMPEGELGDKIRSNLQDAEDNKITLGEHFYFFLT